MRVAVLGLGYVGCVTAACLAEQGHQVIGVESQRAKREMINSGRSPIVEPGLEDIIAAAVAAGRLTATGDTASALAEAEVCLVSVGTPSLPNGSLDLSQLERVCEEIGAAIAQSEKFIAVVVRSTMLPGSLEERLVPVLEKSSGRQVDESFGVAMCPEFLRETSAVADFYQPPFSVLGVREARTEAAMRELLSFLDAPFHAVPVRTAEALKYACNAFHAVKVTFANEMARFCDSQGVDARRVMELFCQDAELNISPRYLRPGFAYGGSCLPKDVRALVHRARQDDEDLPMLSSLSTSNERHIQRALDRLVARDVRRVALLGLSFKSGTDDLRESPYVALAERLIGKGIELRIYDPVVNPARLVGSNRAYMQERLPHLMRILHDDIAEATAGVDAVVLATRAADVVGFLRDDPPSFVLDLDGRLAADVERSLRQRVGDGVSALQGLAW